MQSIADAREPRRTGWHVLVEGWQPSALYLALSNEVNNKGSLQEVRCKRSETNNCGADAKGSLASNETNHRSYALRIAEDAISVCYGIARRSRGAISTRQAGAQAGFSLGGAGSKSLIGHRIVGVGLVHEGPHISGTLPVLNWIIVG
jgi:hypothetical protein